MIKGSRHTPLSKVSEGQFSGSHKSAYSEDRHLSGVDAVLGHIQQFNQQGVFTGLNKDRTQLHPADLMKDFKIDERDKKVYDIQEQRINDGLDEINRSDE